MRPKEENPELRRALACLAHPWSLAAMALLLVNDHLLRVVWPSWWSGKLGDFAWLFFFPFALAAGIALLLPKRWGGEGRRAALVALLAFGLTGGIFSLAKAWPVFHAGLLRIARISFNFPVSWRLDPTDLIALPALLAAMSLWRRSAQDGFGQIPWFPLRKVRSAPWLLLCLAASLTVANGIGPEVGIVCLEVQEGQLYASSFRQVYRGHAAAMAWEPVSGIQLNCSNVFPPPDELLVSDPADDQVRYRIVPGQTIERSTNGGQTWKIEVYLMPTTQVMQAYTLHKYQGNARIVDGPFSAGFDPASGSLVLAMGHGGLLVRQVDGYYHWVEVGPHQHTWPGFGEMLLLLLPGEGLMTLILGVLAVLYLRLRQRASIPYLLVAGAAAVLWAVVALFFPPALASGAYANLFLSIMLMGAALLLFPLLLDVTFQAALDDPSWLRQNLLVFGGTAVLFFLPLAAWGACLLEEYRLAQVIGLGLAAAAVYQLERRGWSRLKTFDEDGDGVPKVSTRERLDWLVALSAGLLLIGLVIVLWRNTLPWLGYLLIALGLGLVGVLFMKRRK